MAYADKMPIGDLTTKEAYSVVGSSVDESLPMHGDIDLNYSNLTTEWIAYSDKNGLTFEHGIFDIIEIGLRSDGVVVWRKK